MQSSSKANGGLQQVQTVPKMSTPNKLPPAFKRDLELRIQDLSDQINGVIIDLPFA